MRVTAAVAAGRGNPLTVKDLDLAEPGFGEVQVRMVATGVCHTDADVRKKSYPTRMLNVLGPIGCSVQTGAGAVLSVLDPEAGSSIVIFGAGAVGMSALLAARVANASTVIAVDIVEDRLSFAAELGATHVINSLEEDAVARIREITGGGVDYAVDSTGDKTVSRTMVDSLGTRGHAALVGLASPGTESTIDIGTTILTGARISLVIEGDSVPQSFIPRLISLHEEGRFPLDKLISSYAFEDINTAFDDTRAGAVLMPVVVFQPPSENLRTGSAARPWGPPPHTSHRRSRT